MALWGSGCGGDGDGATPVPENMGAGPDTVTASQAPETTDPGGQTGMEGVCLALPPGVVPPTAEEVAALITGTRHSVLSVQHYDQAKVEWPMTVELSPAGEGRSGAGCGESYAQPVVGTLSVPALDLAVPISGDVLARSPRFASFKTEVPRTLVAAMDLPSDSAEDPELLVAFRPDRIYGEVYTGEPCARVVFPPERACQTIHPDLPPQDRFAGFDPAEALARFPLTFPLRWEDGAETSIHLELVGEPAFACGDFPEFRDTYRRLALGQRVRVTTDDGRLAVELPTTIRVEIATDYTVSLGAEDATGWDGAIHFYGAAAFPRARLEAPPNILALDLPDADRLVVRIDSIMNDDGTGTFFPGATVEIQRADPAADAPDLASPLDVGDHGMQGCFAREVLTRAHTPEP